LVIAHIIYRFFKILLTYIVKWESGMAFEEKIYQANNGVVLTYIEDPYPIENFIGETKLVVIFQSLGDEKSIDPIKRYPYSLLAGLKYINCRKIYIKDDRGHVGDYYLGINGRFDTKDAVVEFLNEKIVKYKILKENVIGLGFSKGGFAALIFSHLVGFNSVICAIPQFDLVKWIDKYKPHLSYIYPENATDDDKNVYSTYLERVIRKSVHAPKTIYLFTSRNDETFSDHIPDLLIALKEKSRSRIHVSYNDETCVTRHNNVVKNSMNEILLALTYEVSSDEAKKFFK